MSFVDTKDCHKRLETVVNHLQVSDLNNMQCYFVIDVYHILTRSFIKDLILAFLARLFNSLKLFIANNSSCLDVICFKMYLSRIAKIMSC